MACELITCPTAGAVFLQKDRRMVYLWNKILMGTSFIISGISFIYGGWTQLLTTLCICMVIDTLIALGVSIMGKSPKSNKGALSSSAFVNGMFKKLFSLFFIIIAHRVDLLCETDYFKTSVTIGFILNEILSIVENAGMAGVKWPPVVTKMIDILKKESEENPEDVRMVQSK